MVKQKRQETQMKILVLGCLLLPVKKDDEPTGTCD